MFRILNAITPKLLPSLLQNQSNLQALESNYYFIIMRATANMTIPINFKESQLKEHKIMLQLLNKIIRLHLPFKIIFAALDAVEEMT